MPLLQGSSREPSPNRGASVKAEDAVGPERESVSAWKQRAGVDAAKQIRIVKLAHMRYGHSDLGKITAFLRDFGMHVAKKTEDTIWFRGYGPDPYCYVVEKTAENVFLGGTFLVETYADLEKAAALPGAGPIEDLTASGSPGGGQRVVLHDPEGFPVNLLFGQTPSPAEGQQLPEKLIYNDETEKPRAGAFLRFRPGPAAVHKLGHYGLCVKDLQRQVEFYTRNFNIVPSDILHVKTGGEGGGEGGGEKKDVAVFLHVDRGEEYVDHHSFFMSTAATGHVHHCSFEVHDLDTQSLGHKWLAEKGYKPVWGIGRHILGSQLFDYWWDTSGFMVEHYADGDLVNESTPIGHELAGNESLAVWGPEVPSDFLD